MGNKTSIFVGTAAWAVPKALAASFPIGSSHLHSYSQVLSCVEINTSFYRDHKAQTYEKWANATPDHFRFSVKLSRVLSHDEGLDADAERLREVLSGIMRLGSKLGVILIQLPPKLAFREAMARSFFAKLRAIYEGPAVVEPRHRSWLGPQSLKVFQDFDLGKVIADPDPCPSVEDFQKATRAICYFRWHGSPVIYESRYKGEALDSLRLKVERLRSSFESIWIVFDNTTFAWATVNALEMRNRLAPAFKSSSSHARDL